MLFTRSVRRKMASWLMLVLLIVVVLSASSIWTVSSYRELVRDLQHDFAGAPRRTELVDSLISLLEPFDKPGDQFTYEFQTRLVNANQNLRAFREKLAQLPNDGPESEDNNTWHLLGEFSQRLDHIGELAAAINNNTTARQPQIDRLKHETLHIQLMARQLPDPHADLDEPLLRARKAYRSAFGIILATSLLAFGLLVGVIVFCYRWVVAPIRQLYQGAKQVADGNFECRVHMNSNDEISQLADAFNEMTSRFQDIKSDLDHQVRERSNQLVRSERLADVGFLAAGMAHEINNPLQAMVTACNALKSRVPQVATDKNSKDVEIITQYLEMIEKESMRCREITARLLDFSRGSSTPRQRVNVTEVVTEVLELIGHMSKFRDRTIKFPRTRPCMIQCNLTELKQVVLNLVANGLESTDSGGELSIEIIEHTDEVVLSFTDNGCGMTEKTLENLFEPFYTNRRSGKGTGLGLSITHRIVAEHGGTIDAKSAGPGKGSQFKVIMPRTAAIEVAA